MFTQLTNQINVMIKATLEHSDSRGEMGFMIKQTMLTLNVAKCALDGSCLFSSIAHQLFQDKIKDKQ